MEEVMMYSIKENDILCCVDEKDSHFLKICKVKNIEYDESYPIITNVTVLYEDENVTYKAIDMEYNFIVVKGQPLIFD